MSTTCQFDSTAVPVSRPPELETGTSHTDMQINVLFKANTMELDTAQRTGNGTKDRRIGVLFSFEQKSFSSVLRLDWLLVSPTFPVTLHREKTFPEESSRYNRNLHSAHILQRSAPQPLPTISSRTRTVHQMQ